MGRELARRNETSEPPTVAVTPLTASLHRASSPGLTLWLAVRRRWHSTPKSANRNLVFLVPVFKGAKCFLCFGDSPSANVRRPEEIAAGELAISFVWFGQ